MAKQPNNPNQTVIFIGILLLMLGFGSIYYYFMPQLVTARTNQVTAQATKDGLASDIATLQKAKSDVGAAQATLTTEGVNFNQISQNYPAYEDVPGIYLEMENIIQNLPNVHTVTYTVGQPVVSTQGDVNVPISISAIGLYTDLKSFINTLQTTTRPLSFDHVAFSQYSPSTTDKNASQIPTGSYLLTLGGFVRAEKLSASYTTTKATP